MPPTQPLARPVNSATDVTAPEISFLESNLSYLAPPSSTDQLVREASPAGELVSLPRGLSALMIDGQMAGAPPSDESLSDVPNARGVIVVLGLGTGHTARAVRALASAPVIVFEPNPGVVRRHLELGPMDLGDLDVVCTLQDLTQLWHERAHGNTEALLVRTPGYGEQHPELDKLLCETMAQLVGRESINNNTHRRRARAWIEDLIENISALSYATPFTALSGKLSGLPAFIVGAGPSLEKNAELLRQASERGLVIAVNSAGRALASRALEPHVLACLESIDVSHLIEDLPFIDRVARAFSLTAHPRTFRTGTGPLLPLFEALPEIAGPIRELCGCEGISVCGSVSTAAFSLAQRLGCSPIVFVGQDLAYTNGRAYASGTPYESSRVRIQDGALHHDWAPAIRETHARAASAMHDQEALEMVAAWGGEGTVISGAAFAPVRVWLEGAAEVLRRERPNLRLINATEGGAHIAGFEDHTLASVLEQLPVTSVPTPVELARMASTQRPPLPAHRIAAWAERQRKLANDVARAARRAEHEARSAMASLASNQPERVRRAFARLDNAERLLTQAAASAPLVNAYSFAAVDSVLEDAREDSDGVDAEAEAMRGLSREAAVAGCVCTAASELADKLQQLQRQLALAAQDNAPTASRG